MSASDRRVREVFIELSDTLVDDFDIIEFLDRLAVRCSELLWTRSPPDVRSSRLICGPPTCGGPDSPRPPSRPGTLRCRGSR